MNACVVIPAFNAARTVADVVAELRRELPGLGPEAFVVVDDGSRDATAERARAAGAMVVAHRRNQGKGAALRTGLEAASTRGFDVALSVDADGQHPADAARAVLRCNAGPGALVLGVRDLARDGAPPENRFSNGVSNFFLSRFTGRPIADTQCGLRRYPVRPTLLLGCRAQGYGFEAEVLLRALGAGLPLAEVPIRVRYPPDRVTHFDSVRDPARIVAIVLATLFELHVRAPTRGASPRGPR